MDQNCLTTIAALVGIMAPVVTVLFRALREENAYLKVLLERALANQEGQTEVTRDLTDVVKTSRRH